jgi:hypothetical protein
VSELATIRPPDPSIIVSEMVRLGRYTSAQASRLILHCFFRDAQTALDLTYGAGRFWKLPMPPGLALTSNNLDPSSHADLHLDFTATGLPDEAYDVAIWDPPHLPHLGDTSFMARRYGTIRSTAGLQTMIEAGVLEAWRIARVGIIVKLADSPNGGAYLPLTSWATEALGVWPVYVMHTIGRPSPRPRGEIARVPRNNGADWLVFRKGGRRYPDFVKLYERQQALHIALPEQLPCCASCNAPLEGKRADAVACSPACRQKLYRQRSRAS